jgi:hypothetical protein
MTDLPVKSPAQPGKWRLIVDLSHPEEKSVNDETLLSKVHISGGGSEESAGAGKDPAGQTRCRERIQDCACPLRGQEAARYGWRGRRYVDTALPFGLRSAPKILTSTTQMTSCCLEHLTQRREGIEALKRTLEICAKLEIPIAFHKTEGPLLVIVFLGIEIDTQRLKSWSTCGRRAGGKGRRACTKKVGQLSHACCVVRPGRSFLRRMINLSSSKKVAPQDKGSDQTCSHCGGPHSYQVGRASV